MVNSSKRVNNFGGCSTGRKSFCFGAGKNPGEDTAHTSKVKIVQVADISGTQTPRLLNIQQNLMHRGTVLGTFRLQPNIRSTPERHQSNVRCSSFGYKPTHF